MSAEAETETETGAAAATWTASFEGFFRRAGLHQCLRTLQVEAVVFPAQPRGDFTDCLRQLAADIQGYLAQLEGAGQGTAANGAAGAADSVAQSTKTREQTAQMIEEFVDQQWTGICRSNRDEFLVAGDGRGEDTCARTDARGGSCGVKLQADAGKDASTALGRSTAPQPDGGDDDDVSGRAPQSLPLSGLEERVENIRDHLNVRFVPESADVHRRVSALEDRIMQLEREFPPWAAEHFKQPGRRYTQPPPVTVYRLLPPQGPSASVPAAAAAAAAAGAPPRRTPHAPTPPPKRRRANAPQAFQGPPGVPLDETGKPVFRACGRGVNSSLTRTVLAQLQARRMAQEAQETKEAPHSTS
ncbi:hypothetical protein H4R18_000033 [Coemansia javaensis]|uniref:Uncharacterized protein n=1 Tax=Coemansia javaensis TaxID=2761396 RepID=A0A9W8HHV7_9FUNG|nr:hypothetical protein H4R18_000033 [Coemansia javaensis]